MLAPRRMAGRLYAFGFSRASQSYKLLRQAFLYLYARATGRSYADYFAWLMDRSIREYPNWGERIDYRYQIDYLVKHGLKPQSKLLDLGCGPLAAGALMIDYLQPGNYVGADVSAGLIEEAERRVLQHGLLDKRPVLLHVRHGDAAWLRGRTFDFIWAQSVLTHMPPKEIAEMLRDIRPSMGSQSVFYATFAKSAQTRHVGFMHWYFASETLREIAQSCGFAFEVMDDWKHPLDPQGTDTMARLRLA